MRRVCLIAALVIMGMTCGLVRMGWAETGAPSQNNNKVENTPSPSPRPSPQEGEGVKGKTEVSVKDGKVSVDLVGAELGEVLKKFSIAAGIEITVGEGVSGKISMKFADLSLREGLEKIIGAGQNDYALEYIGEGISKVKLTNKKAKAEKQAKVEKVVDIAAYVKQLGKGHTHSERIMAYEKILDLGKEAIPFLIEALDSDDSDLKFGAIKILEELKSTEAVPKLLTLLNDPDQKTKIASAFTLGKIKDARATEPLITVLKTTDDDSCKKAAIVGLGFLGDKKAMPYLEDKLKDSSQSVRIMAAGALGFLGNNEGYEEALKSTYSDNVNIRIDAVQTLGVMGDKRGVARLNEMLADPNIGWENHTRLALKQIEVSNLPKEQKVSALGTCLSDKNQEIAEWAVGALAEDGTSQAVSLLEQRAKSSEDKIGYMASLKLKTIKK